MKKVWIFVIVGFLLVVTAIGVGGKIYMDKRAEQKEAEKIEVEKESVVALKARYANIKTVEIEKSVYNKKTGAYSMYVKMTNDRDKSVNFSYSFWKEQEKVGSAGLENKDVQVKGITTNEVKVIYSNNKEESI